MKGRENMIAIDQFGVVWMTTDSGCVITNYQELKATIPDCPNKEDLPKMDFYTDQNVVEK